MLIYNLKFNDDSVSVDLIIDGNLIKLSKDNPQLKNVLNILKSDKTMDEKKESLIELIPSIKKKTLVSGKNLFITDDSVIFNGFEFKSLKFRNKVSNLYKNNVSLKHIEKFCENLLLNPSQHSIQMLFDFLEGNDIPITDEGTFLGYKAVNNDHWDIHSRTIKYEVGSVIELEREKVDTNPDNHCSSGLHVGSLKYAKGFGPLILLVEVNPKDVVSVPNDYNFEKLRCCKLRVASVLHNVVSLEEKCYSSSTLSPIDDDDDLYDDSDDLDEYDDDYDDSDDCETENSSVLNTKLGKQLGTLAKNSNVEAKTINSTPKYKRDPATGRFVKNS